MRVHRGLDREDRREKKWVVVDVVVGNIVPRCPLTLFLMLEPTAKSGSASRTAS